MLVHQMRGLQDLGPGTVEVALCGVQETITDILRPELAGHVDIEGEILASGRGATTNLLVPKFRNTTLRTDFTYH